MTRSPSLAPLLERRLTALHEHLPGAREGDVTGVHQARVATRRLREILPLLSVLDRGRDVARAQRAVRRVTRALGPVREADVALGHLAEHLADRPDEGPQGVPVRRWLEALRTSRRDAMLAAIDEEAIGRLWRRADALRAIAAASDTAAREWRDVLAGRVRARGSALAREVETAGVMYAADALHAVRIATKKLRYAIEVAGELRLVPSAAVLRTLKRQQDLLGRIHDLEVLAGLADRASADAAGRLNVGRLVGEWHRECRELHARYLRARAATTRVTALACDEMYKRIGGAADSARPAHRRRRAARAA